MALLFGRYDDRGDPLVEIRVSADDDNATFWVIYAVVDTGFQGFLRVPDGLAEAIGINKAMATKLTFASGNAAYEFGDLGRIKVDAKTATEFVIRGDSTEALVGMEFLRQFGFSLVLTPKKVILFDLDSWKEAASEFPRPGR